MDGTIVIGAIDDATRLPLRMEDMDYDDDEEPTPRPVEISKKKVVISAAGTTVVAQEKKDQPPVLPDPIPAIVDDLKVTDFHEEDSKDNGDSSSPVPITTPVLNSNSEEKKDDVNDNKETAKLDASAIIPSNDGINSNANLAADTNTNTNTTVKEPNEPEKEPNQPDDKVVPIVEKPLPRRGFLGLGWGKAAPAPAPASSVQPGGSDDIEKPVPRPGTKWKPPSLEKANEYRLQSMYREGTAPLWSTDLIQASDLSRGVVLHFFFLRSVIICMCVMTLLSFPILFFCYYGSRIPLALQDPIGLYRFTLGNLGYDPTSPTYSTDSACTQIPDWQVYNGTCIHLLGGELKLSEVSNIVTTFEFLQVVAFFAFVFHFSTLIGFQGATPTLPSPCSNGQTSHESILNLPYP